MNTALARTGVIRRRLSFRCARCRAVASAQAEWCDGVAATVECGTCGEAYLLPASRNRGASDSHYRERARALALANGIDLATATSVMEEIIPLSQAVALRRPAATPAPAPPRANRKWLRASVAGVAVVLSLFLLAMKREAPREVPVAGPVHEPAGAIESAPLAPPAPVPVQRESPLVSWHDDAGSLTEIAGPDPASVLRGFCREVQGLEPVAVNAASPPNPGARIGVVRRMTDQAGRLAVAIRRDPRTGRWFIGDRRGAIRLSPAQSVAVAGSDLERPSPGGG